MRTFLLSSAAALIKQWVDHIFTITTTIEVSDPLTRPPNAADLATDRLPLNLNNPGPEAKLRNASILAGTEH